MPLKRSKVEFVGNASAMRCCGILVSCRWSGYGQMDGVLHALVELCIESDRIEREDVLAEVGQ